MGRAASGRVRGCSLCGDPFCFDRECAVVNREALHQRTYRPCENCGELVYYSPDDVVMLHRDGSYFCDGYTVVHEDGRVVHLGAS